MSNQSLEANILKTVEIRLGKYFQSVIKQEKEGGEFRQLTTAFVLSNDRFSIFDYLQKQAKDSQGKIKFPFLGFSLDTLSINRQTSARTASQHFRQGSYVGSGQGNLSHVVRSLPVEFNCNLIFLTDDFWQSLSFSAKLLLANVDKSILDFQCVYQGVNFSIVVNMAEDVTFPPKDNTLEIANLFEFNTTFKIQGWITDNKDFKDLQTTTDVTKIVISPAIVPSQYSGLEFLSEGDISDDFFIVNPDGTYEQIVIEI